MVVVVLALVAAALSAVSAAGEQRAAYRLARERAPRPGAPGRAGRSRGAGRTRRRAVGAGFALALFTSPLWLLSWGVDAASFGAQAAALHLGSLSVVQPLMVGTLLFSVPLAALGTGRRPSARDWSGALAVSAGLVLVLATREVPAAAGDGGAGPMLVPAMGGVVLLAAMLALVARGRSASVRAALLATAAGALFSVGAATTKLTTAAATEGFGALLTGWPGYALAAVSVASFALQQSAYAAGPLAAAMTAVVVTDPLLSYLLGVVGFGEPLPGAGLPLALAALGVVVLVAGVLVLAHSPLLRPTPVEADAPAAAQPPASRSSAAAQARQAGVATSITSKWSAPSTRTSSARSPAATARAVNRSLCESGTSVSAVPCTHTVGTRNGVRSAGEAIS